MKQCLHCKKEFEPLKPKAIFCSAKCRVYWHRANKKEEPAHIQAAISEKREPNISTSFQQKPKIIKSVAWYDKAIEGVENEQQGMELLADIRSEPFTRQEKMGLISKLTNGRLNS